MRFETDYNETVGGKDNPWVVSCRRSQSDAADAVAAFNNEAAARDHEKKLNAVYHGVLDAVMPDPMTLVAAVNAALLDARK